jgi:glycosyltransferase involved in cell wall biosynthesis
VESTLADHARGLAALGYRVRIVSGAGAPFDPTIDVHIDPLFGSRDPAVLAVKRELDAGAVTAAFHDLVARQRNALRAALDGCEVVIAHNLHTLNKNLPLTCALLDLDLPRVIAWCHDLAWTNPQYQPELHPGYPWDVLRQIQPNTRYVTVSEPRRAELAELLGLNPADIDVIVPGIDVPRLLAWTPHLRDWEARLHLLDADGLLLLPARLTRRKNIAYALRVLAALRASDGRDYRLIVTGPPGPHNPANPGYLGELLALRAELGLNEAAHFLYELGADETGEGGLLVDDDTMAALYRTADALLFPSTQEGFGIPMLEAGLAGLPIFCAAIPPLRATGGADAHYFDPIADAPEVTAAAIQRTLTAPGPAALRIRARQQYRWEAIIRDRIVPLIEEV